MYWVCLFLPVSGMILFRRKSFKYLLYLNSWGFGRIFFHFVFCIKTKLLTFRLNVVCLMHSAYTNFWIERVRYITHYPPFYPPFFKHKIMAQIIRKRISVWAKIFLARYMKFTIHQKIVSFQLAFGLPITVSVTFPLETQSLKVHVEDRFSQQK